MTQQPISTNDSFHKSDLSTGKALAGETVLTEPRLWHRHLGSVAIALIFIASMWALTSLTHHMQLSQIVGYIEQLPSISIVLAVVLTIVSYLLLTVYDLISARYAKADIGYRAIAPISFSAFAVGHNVGLASVSGGAIRYRAYSMIGLSSVQIAQIVLLIPITFTLGSSLLIGGVFIIEPQEVIFALPISSAAIRTVGVCLVLLVGAYLIASRLVKAPFLVKSHQFSFPSISIAVSQVVVSSLDLVVASTVLYVLLPDFTSIGFSMFLGAYLLAIVAGMVSSVPGGIGVFESALILLLPTIPPAKLLGAIVVYRAIYYFLPLAVALLIIAWREVSHSYKRKLKELTSTGADWGTRIVPQITSICVFFVGITLVLGGTIPLGAEQLAKIRPLIPIQILEMSHMLSSVVGLGLLLVAHGLYKRLKAARDITVALLIVATLASLVQIGNWGYTVFLLAMIAIITMTHREFFRGGELIERSVNFNWMVCVVLVIAASVWLGIFAHRHTEYSNELWWRFTFKGDAARMLRAEFLVIVLFIVYLTMRILRGQPTSEESCSPDQLPLIKTIIAQNKNCEANIALLGDKKFLIDPNNDAFIMYQKSGRSLIALGDPVGNKKRFESLAWAFRELCDQTNTRCAFYQVSEEYLPIYIDLGLSFSKLGEEARVALPGFSLEGSKRAAQRQTVNRAQRDGVEFCVVNADDVKPLIPELRVISDEWLKTKNAAEKSFSLGFFQPEYLQQFDFALVKVNNKIVAFANIWKTDLKEEVSVDLMRFGDAAPKGVMEYLFVQLFLWGKDNGYQWFNLGMAPLAGLETRALSPSWNKLANLVYRLGENFYSFEGLYFYKNKFDPHWQSKYLACKGGIELPKVLLDVSVLISGGFKEMFLK
ncbi:bifunctional lysylphosphatidylglycerol flippase/synthetase MprF [Teredinibacter waterburyi]|uniref:bifunctional lysylphosphatidylglycerol flippase/synthetase MprF n=1 Tax=Teredinibacter waterburyi TaxID=1500538 RepID=UPI00165F8B9A|nr:bifunctional lysylphosphatidylglycerol flippase/synthetase MprF [Teredinibacter waterburyi]